MGVTSSSETLWELESGRAKEPGRPGNVTGSNRPSNNLQNMSSSSEPLIHPGCRGVLQPIPVPIGQKAGNTLGRVPVYGREDTLTYTLTTTGTIQHPQYPWLHVFGLWQQETHRLCRTCKLHTHSKDPCCPGHPSQGTEPRPFMSPYTNQTDRPCTG